VITRAVESESGQFWLAKIKNFLMESKPAPEPKIWVPVPQPLVVGRVVQIL